MKENFSIGVSLDGVASINDTFRIDHLGKSHHSEIEKAILDYPLLKERVGILTTVTSINDNLLVEVAEYVQKLGVSCWDCTLFQSEGRGKNSKNHLTPSTQNIISSYFSLMDSIEEGKFQSLEIRPILHYLRNVLSYERRNMCLRNGCGAASDLVSISVDGTIEGCDCIKE